MPIPIAIAASAAIQVGTPYELWPASVPAGASHLSDAK